MDDARAAANLQLIRTLMERAALYRRALAPVSLAVGALGLLGGLLGWWTEIGTARGFSLFWMVVATLSLASGLLITRQQALRAQESFWSPPARRIAQAFGPGLFAGLVAGMVVALPSWVDPLRAWWLPGIWMVLYGGATHAAASFLSRSTKLFAWVFVVLGTVAIWQVATRSHAGGMPPLRLAHLVMAAAFGGFHLAYGAYLAVTEKRRTDP